MSRTKTYPNAEVMWDRTLKYLYFLHANKWLKWTNWLSHYEYKIKWCSAPALTNSELEILWQSERDFGPLVGEFDSLCVVKKSHRLLLAGDILVLAKNNGMKLRFPVFGVSSKGVKLNFYWLPVECLKQKGTIEIVELPGDFISRRWDDPAIRQFVVNLRASSRSWVGAGIPAP